MMRDADEGYLESQLEAELNVDVGGHMIRTKMAVVYGLVFPAFLGVDYLTQSKSLLNFNYERISLPGGGSTKMFAWEENIRIAIQVVREERIVETESKDEAKIEKDFDDVDEEETYVWKPSTPVLEPERILKEIKIGEMESKKKRDIESTILQFIDVFSGDTKNPGCTGAVEHSIHTGDHPPINRRSYRTSLKEEEYLKTEIQNMLQNRIIEPSDSLWAAPIVLAKKKDGTLGF